MTDATEKADAPPLRLAVLTLEALCAAGAVRRFVAENAGRIAMVGISDVYRPARGGILRQALGHARRSGFGVYPYLAANFTVPSLTPHPARWLAAAAERRPLARLCADLGVPVETIADVNAPETRARIAASGADLIVTFHFDQILDAETIAAAPLGGLNVHPSLLPAHRGPTPTIHALLDDEPRFGVTVHRLAPRIDAGPVLAQAALDLPGRVTAVEAARRLHDAALPLLSTVLDQLAAGTARERMVEPLPYLGWPDRRQLRALRRRGRALADWRDLVRALNFPTN